MLSAAELLPATHRLRLLPRPRLRALLRRHAHPPGRPDLQEHHHLRSALRVRERGRAGLDGLSARPQVAVHKDVGPLAEVHDGLLPQHAHHRLRRGGGQAERDSRPLPALHPDPGGHLVHRLVHTLCPENDHRFLPEHTLQTLLRCL